MATVLTLRRPATASEAAVDEAEAEAGIPVTMGLMWVLVIAAAFAIVLYGFEPLLQQRTQSRLLTGYRQALEQAVALGGAPPATAVPRRGASVGLLEVQGLHLQQVVVEGARPAQTRKGPGHVPGTAGLGQAGNSVVVARRSMFGGPFGGLRALQKGAQIVVTTTQGQSTYRVLSSRTALLDDTGTDGIEGPSTENRLTLVTSASWWPLNGTLAQITVARLEHRPFAATKQARRVPGETGAGSEGRDWGTALLGLAVLVAACAAAVWCYRNLSTRTAYLITAIPLAVLVVIVGETVGPLLPAWT